MNNKEILNKARKRKQNLKQTRILNEIKNKKAREALNRLRQ